MRLALASLLLIACNSAQVTSGPSCPSQETAPPPLPPQAMATDACSIGAIEPADEHLSGDPIPLAEDGALATQAQGTLADQMALVKAALDADLAGNFPACVTYEQKALAISENGRSRLHLASCERRAGKLIDALADSQKALEIGVESQDASLAKVARRRVVEMQALVPHVRFVESPGLELRTFTVDNREIRHEHLAKTFSLDPGHHVLVLEGTESGREFQRTCTIELNASTVLPILLTAR